jgi:sialate O-acetylesterase
MMGMNWNRRIRGICRSLGGWVFGTAKGAKIFGMLGLVWFVGIFLVGEVRALTVAPVFGDGMVLQRDRAVPFWGRAAAGEAVSVEYQKVARRVVAGNDGVWKLTLPPLKASAVPASVTVRGAGDVVVFNDVLVGEVWVGAGQSNMAGRVTSYKSNDGKLAELLRKAPYPNLRLMRSVSLRWMDADAAAIDNFSAQMFAFGVRLQKDLGVPVGLMVGAVGGTPSGQWMSRDAFERGAFRRGNSEAAFARYQQELVAWQNASPCERGDEPQPPGDVDSGDIGKLYERHIRDFLGYGIRGVLWDQGEEGTGVRGVDQFSMMGALMEGWRREWNVGTFPFLFVQKPSGGGCAYFSDQPLTSQADAFTPLLPSVTSVAGGAQRVEYLRMMSHPNAWMVPVSDLGGGIHPSNKWAYGNRAAHIALVAAYGSKMVSSGPRYRSHQVEGNRIRVSFTNVSLGLVAAHQSVLQGFAIAGEDGRFVWANATIDRDTVLVSSARVARPRYVRYAYAGKRAWANLFNKDGLPALTFDSRVP